jgi:hypothetical protein
VHFIQRLRFVALEGQELRPHAEVGDLQYRIGYYIVSAKDKWWWAQLPADPRGGLAAPLGSGPRGGDAATELTAAPRFLCRPARLHLAGALVASLTVAPPSNGLVSVAAAQFGGVEPDALT